MFYMKKGNNSKNVWEPHQEDHKNNDLDMYVGHVHPCDQRSACTQDTQVVQGGRGARCACDSSGGNYYAAPAYKSKI